MFRLLIGIAILNTLILPSPVWAQPPLTPEQQRILEGLQKIRWQQGPGVFPIGDQATIQLPRGFEITDPANAKSYYELAGNRTAIPPVAVVKPVNSLEWELIFSFEDVGFVNDSEAAEFNPDELLNQLRANTDASNELRAQEGIQKFFLDGWLLPPEYSTASRRLTLAIRGHMENGFTIGNVDTRILGRHGVMTVKLIADPSRIESLIPTVQGLLQGFTFNSGNDYASWQAGDKVAAYGVTALVTGSAAAVAAKGGLFQKLGLFIGKFFYVIAAAVGAMIWKFRSSASPDPLAAVDAVALVPSAPALPAPSTSPEERPASPND